jgi:hypothetical protein
MSGFTEKQASGAFDQEGALDTVLSLETSQAMLPLVQRIVTDLIEQHRQMDLLDKELQQLDKLRRSLDWPRRARRYQLQEELTSREASLRETAAELEALGLVLLDERAGLIGFPTRVNHRSAYFTWQPGDQGVLYWMFPGGPARNPIPEHWNNPEPVAPKRKTRRRKKD